MLTPFLTWALVLVLLVIIVFITSARSISGLFRQGRFFGMNREKDEFFVPGDRLESKDADYEEYD